MTENSIVHSVERFRRRPHLWRLATARVAVSGALASAVIATAGAAQPRVIQMGGELNRGGVELGIVEDVAIDSLRRVLVLDSKARRVLTFDSVGRAGVQFGGQGRGPGEFVEPDALDVDADGTVLVLDWRQRRIARFTPSYVHRVDYRIPGSLSDICALAGTIYGYGIARDTTPIQVLHVRGDSLVRARGIGGTAFGRDLGPGLELLPVFASGRLACFPGRNTVIWPLTNVAEVRFLDVARMYAQRAHPVEGFTEMRVDFDAGQNTIRMSYGANERSDHIVAAAVAGDSAVVLTIGTQEPGNMRREYRSYQTQVLVLDGDQTRNGARTPSAAVLGATVQDLAVCYVNDPVPSVWIIRGAGLLTTCSSDVLARARDEN